MRQFGDDPHEQRHRVPGQVGIGRLGQGGAVEFLARLELQGHHAGAAPGTGHLDTEDGGLLDLRVGRDGRLHLGGRHVLALPPEGVPEPVGECGVPEALRSHQVAGVEPDVAVGEGVADQLLLRGRLVGVPVERLETADLGQQQTGLTLLDLSQPAVLAAGGFTGLQVVLDEGDRAGADPGRLGHVEHVDERRVALAGTVELADPRDPEAFGELVPDGRT